MPILDFTLTGQIALVTGASRGIGEAIARGFAEQGATVVLASRKQEGLDQVAEAIEADGGKAVPIACHAGNVEQIAGLFERIESEFGRLDILVRTYTFAVILGARGPTAIRRKPLRCRRMGRVEDDLVTYGGVGTTGLKRPLSRPIPQISRFSNAVCAHPELPDTLP
ncbi:MAG: SDR family NAD(P)-dependent oxidoreductase [Acidobacteria bacterium]|nr:SDR family NAD(P)-dependent oxidoreductase [Acidobacteriota bacterium]